MKRYTTVRQGEHKGKRCMVIKKLDNGDSIVLIDGHQVTLKTAWLSTKNVRPKPDEPKESKSVQTVSGGLPTLNKKKR